MKSCSFLLISVLFLLSAPVIADTPLIRTTVADSSRVVFIAQTPLSREEVSMIIWTLSDSRIHRLPTAQGILNCR